MHPGREQQGVAQGSRAARFNVPAAGDGSGKRASPPVKKIPPYALRNALALAAGTFALLLLGALLTIRLGQGTVLVEGPPDGDLPDDVSIVLSGGGKRLEITSADKWKLSVQPGSYEVHLQGGSDTFEIKNQEISVQRFGKQIVRVVRQNEPPVASETRPAEARPAVSTPAPKQIAGTWQIKEAENLLGQPYGGQVKMQLAESGVVEMQWLDEQGKTVQTGVGLIEDGHLFAAWGVIPSYGFCLYKLLPDGRMEGRWTVNGAGGQLSIENASGGKPGKLEGAYNIQGKPLGMEAQYRGTLSVTKIDDTYAVEWDTAEGKYPGIGLRHGDWLAIGWSVQKAAGFGVVAYKLDGEAAHGRWGMMGQNGLSFEVLQREPQAP